MVVVMTGVLITVVGTTIVTAGRLSVQPQQQRVQFRVIARGGRRVVDLG